MHTHTRVHAYARTDNTRVHARIMTSHRPFVVLYRPFVVLYRPFVVLSMPMTRRHSELSMSLTCLISLTSPKGMTKGWAVCLRMPIPLSLIIHFTKPTASCANPISMLPASLDWRGAGGHDTSHELSTLLTERACEACGVRLEAAGHARAAVPC